MNTMTAREGRYLTQSADTPTRDRIFVTSVSGYGDIQSLYREATEQELEEHRQWLESKTSEFANNV